MPIAAVGGSIIGGILAGNAASNAAQTQANAANTAAQLQYQSGQQALGFQKQVYGQTQAEEAPYLQAGYGGLANLQYLLGITPQGNIPSFGMPSQGGGIRRVPIKWLDNLNGRSVICPVAGLPPAPATEPRPACSPRRAARRDRRCARRVPKPTRRSGRRGAGRTAPLAGHAAGRRRT